MLSDGHQRKLANLKPFPPGESGCPGGGVGSRKRLREEIAADLGRELSVVERVLLDQVVELVLRSKRETDNVVRTRMAGRVDRILTKLRNPQSTPQPAADEDDLQAYITRAAEGAS